MVKKCVKKEGSAQKPKNDILPKGYDPEQVKNGVRALYQNVEKVSSKNKSLFLDEGDFILLQVACVKIPKLAKRNYRFFLPHGFLKDTSEICLFVRNLSGNKDREYEDTVRHFKNLLREADVKSVSEVISINQLKQEYNTYEMRRRLAARFDFFLGDSRVNDWLNGTVGKEFHRCKKIPSPVQLDSNDLKGAIDKALHKTVMVVTGKGDNYCAKVGNTNQSLQQICENIEAFVKALMMNFPGKWGNVRSIHVRTTNTIAIPIYVAIAIPNTVKIPKVKPRPETRKRPVDEGELSTLPDGYKVIVEPDGTVRVKSEKKEAEDEDDDLLNVGEDFLVSDDEEVSEMDEDEDIMSDSKDAVTKEGEIATSDSEEDEGDVEAAEEAYLQELTMGKSEEGKKRKIGDKEEPVSPKKIRKKMKEESMTLKENAKGKKGAEATPSVKTAKEKKIIEEKAVSLEKTSKKSARGKSVPVSMQWNIEDLNNKSTEQSDNKTKKSIKSKNVDENSNRKDITVSGPSVKVTTKTVVKSVDKVGKRGSEANSSVGILNGKTKISKLGKTKKDSNS